MTIQEEQPTSSVYLMILSTLGMAVEYRGIVHSEEQSIELVSNSIIVNLATTCPVQFAVPPPEVNY